MYNPTLTNLTFQEPHVDHHDQETVQTGRLNWWRKLLAGVANLLFLTDQAVDEPEEAVTAFQQPAIYPINDYAVYGFEYYDLGLYWYDF